MESLKKWHNQGVQLNTLQWSLPERVGEVSSLREQLSSHMRRGDAEIILMCGVNNQSWSHTLGRKISVISRCMDPRQRCGEVRSMVEIAFMAFHPVSLYTFILEQQPQVKNRYLVLTLSYLKHQISNMHNFWPIVGPQEIPGGRCMCFWIVKYLEGNIYNIMIFCQHLGQKWIRERLPRRIAIH